MGVTKFPLLLLKDSRNIYMRKSIQFLILLFVSSNAFALVQSNKVARLYCIYASNGQIARHKLKNSSGNTYKVASRYDAQEKTYLLDSTNYFHALAACHKQVTKGEVVDLRANSGRSETFANFLNPLSKVSIQNIDSTIRDVDPREIFDPSVSIEDQLNELIAFEEEKLVELANLINEDILKFDDAVDALHTVDANLNLDGMFDIGHMASKTQNSTAYKHGKKVFFISSALAIAWVQGPYAAGLAELLFPYVYYAIYGSVPSKATVSYWFLYYPAKKHVANLAYTHAPKIVSALSTAGYSISTAVSNKLESKRNSLDFLDKYRKVVEHDVFVY